MLAILTIILCLSMITLHELGHAYAMYKCGVPIKRIGLLGIPIKGVPFLKKEITLNGSLTTLEIHPLLIGAFVMPEDGSVESQSTFNKVFIFGAGPMVNIFCGAVLLAIAGLKIDSVPFWGVHVWLLGWMPIIAVTIIIFFRPLCYFVAPVVGLLVLFPLVSALLSDNIQGSIGGPVTIVSVLSAGYARIQSLGIFAAMFIAGILSFLIGLTNFLPFAPLDGGRIYHAYLEKLSPFVGRYFYNFTFCLFLALMCIALSNDLRIIF
ncbi:MAG TPA: site-2 protease family protein [Candidatus Paceibacterota bacterium]